VEQSSRSPRRSRRLALALFLIAPIPTSAADVSGMPTSAVPNPSVSSASSPWAISIFGGPLTKRVFATSLVAPGGYANSGIIGADLTYAFYSVPNLPIKIEADLSVAKRFGDDNAWDFGFQPVLRWTWFPWNQWVYTNLRVGPLGVSYATDVTPWELHWAGNDHGSRWLNLFTVEIDFRPAETSPFELYAGWRHRSGMWRLERHPRRLDL
jgi:hypothetical protein